MEDRVEFVSQSPEETKKIAVEFAKTLKKGTTLALYGDLGAGKTTFVQGLAEGLGIKKRIISPTFVILRTYELPNYSSSESGVTPDESRSPSTSSGLNSSRQDGYHTVTRQARTIKTFYHIDLYRLENSKQVEGLGLKELMESPENLVVIEWAEKMKEFLPHNRCDIFFKEHGEHEREITIHVMSQV